MVARRPATGQPAVPSPQVAVGSPDDRPHPDSFMLQTMMEMTRSQGAITEAIKALQLSVDKLSAKIDKTDELKVSMAKVEANVGTLTGEMKSTKDRLDAVRTWVIGATAVIGVAATIVPLAVRFWPSSNPASATRP